MYIYYIQSCSTWVAWGGIRRDRREGEENLHYYAENDEHWRKEGDGHKLIDFLQLGAN